MNDAKTPVPVPRFRTATPRLRWWLAAVAALTGLLVAFQMIAALRSRLAEPHFTHLSPAPRAEKVAIQGQEVAVDLGCGVKLELVRIPPGSFMMGTEKPAHRVTFAKPFYMGKFEVTQDQWRAVTRDNPSRFQSPNYPVEQVSWHRCQQFLKELRERTGHKFALPTEAEWEYACRAGSTSEFCFGDDESGLGEYAWYGVKPTKATYPKDQWKPKPSEGKPFAWGIHDGAGNPVEGSHPVGQKKPNAWGLHDMHGNVCEWCEDVYRHNYDGAPADGSAWLLQEVGGLSFRVLRGGSWGGEGDPMACRSARRVGWPPAWQGWSFGLRVCLRDFSSK